MPVPVLYVPAVQFEHADIPLPVLYVPGEHGVHTEAFVAEL
jgi:hypothetical protein